MALLPTALAAIFDHADRVVAQAGDTAVFGLLALTQLWNRLLAPAPDEGGHNAAYFGVSWSGIEELKELSFSCFVHAAER